MSRNQIMLGAFVAALIALAGIGWYAMRGTVSHGGGQVSATGEHTLGSPTAPIRIVEYASPMCPICAAFNNNEFPRLKSEYIDTGKVFYTFRVFPIGAPDIAVEGIARCLPQDRYFAFTDMMYRNQDKWDPDGHAIADVRAAIIAMAAKAGLPADAAARCIEDKAAQQRTVQVGKDAQAQYGVAGTPTFVIDGEPVYSGEYPWDLLKDQLDRRLAK